MSSQVPAVIALHFRACILLKYLRLTEIFLTDPIALDVLVGLVSVGLCDEQKEKHKKGRFKFGNHSLKMNGPKKMYLRIFFNLRQYCIF